MADAQGVTLEQIWDYEFDEALLSMRIVVRERKLARIRAEIRAGKATEDTAERVAYIGREIQELSAQRLSLRQKVIRLAVPILAERR